MKKELIILYAKKAIKAIGRIVRRRRERRETVTDNIGNTGFCCPHCEKVINVSRGGSF